MLIYNFQKEFLGIDEKDLRTLGFKDLAGLRAEVTDFADLFVKTPGYVHNFKHVHWIDFITCAESSEESKVIINVNNKNYKCTIQIGTTYLVDNPSSKAYIVNLNNLRELSVSESERISGDITDREIPQNTAVAQQIFNTPELRDDFDTEEPTLQEQMQTAENVTEDPYETPIAIDLETEDLAIEEETPSLDDISLDVDFEDDLLVPEVQEEVPAVVTTQTVQENFDNGYVYDPKVASDELGLPLDLIEEFIQDFIEQAKEFKDNLYKAINEDDLNNLRILSHKLKGVAANLRIEDALETLTTVNTSDNLNIVEENLNTFYKIISKLAGEEIAVEQVVTTAKEEPLDIPVQEEPLDLAFKEEDHLYSDPIEIEEPEPKLESATEEPLDLLDMEDDDLDIALDIPEEDAISIQELEIEEPTIEEPEIKESKILYDKNTVANEIGIDNASFNELFDDYITEATELSTTIQSALQNDDLQASRSAALKLKGMSDNMRITSFSSDLETIIHASDTQDIQNSLNTITASIAELSN